jgi:lysophospholipase L1-like esterase
VKPSSTSCPDPCGRDVYDTGFVQVFPLNPIRDYVAMGDSYSSGEGVTPFEPESAEGDNNCHRSRNGAYSQFIKAPYFNAPFAGLVAANAPGITFDFIACSGARTANVRIGGLPHHTEPSQLDQDVVTADTDLVTITIGGIDVGFGDGLRGCFLHACLADDYRIEDGKPWKERIVNEISAVQSDLYNVLMEIRSAAPTARVVVLGYPHLFPNTEAEQSCFKLSPFNDGEQDFIRDQAYALNHRINWAANLAGVDYVDVMDHFDDHEVCGDSGEWINGPSYQFGYPWDPAADESFHPNPEGQRNYAIPANSFLANHIEMQISAQVPSWLRSYLSRGTRDIATFGTLGIEPPPGTVGTCARRRPHAGGRMVFVGEGFEPGTDVDLAIVTQESEIELDTTTVSQESTIRQIVQLPRIARSFTTKVRGKHFALLQATGVDPEGTKRILSQIVVVDPRFSCKGE